MRSNNRRKKRNGQGPGRGWHGNSKAHADAGRLGGIARRRNSSGNNQQKEDGG